MAGGPRRADPASIKALAVERAAIERGLIVCGPQTDPDFPAAVSHLAQHLGWPILADPLSQVRCGLHDRSVVIDAYDAFLRDPAFAGHTVPEVILRFGQVPTSKPLTQYMQKHASARQILIDANGDWNDPSLLASDAIQA